MSEIKAVDFESYVKGWNDRIRYREKTGHWIQNDNGTWSCDQCHSWIPDEQHYYARFCLYCGVKMWVAERDACDGCKTCEFFLHEYWNCQGDQEICPEYLANFIQTEEDEDGGL